MQAIGYSTASPSSSGDWNGCHGYSSQIMILFLGSIDRSVCGLHLMVVLEHNRIQILDMDFRIQILAMDLFAHQGG